jgi:hypothetical protein
MIATLRDDLTLLAQALAEELAKHRFEIAYDRLYGIWVTDHDARTEFMLGVLFDLAERRGYVGFSEDWENLPKEQ